jgi:hypothetical protein
MRYDAERDVYLYCKWCQGRGCVSCKIEADKAYKREFPDGPKPIATFDTTNPEQMASLKSILGADAIRSTFAEAGGDTATAMRDILRKLSQQGSNE